MSSFGDIGQARTYAAINGIDFDIQDDYCEACRAYHVGNDHADDVPVECGETLIHGFSTVLDCNRAPHEDGDHRTTAGTAWNTV